MLNFKTLKACRESSNILKMSELATRQRWKANKCDTLAGAIAYYQATLGSRYYNLEHDMERNSLQARYMKCMRKGGVFS